MGTETTLHILLRAHQMGLLVKLNDPLMGTETFSKVITPLTYESCLLN